MAAEEFEEVDVTVPPDLGGIGGRMLLHHRGRDLQLELPAGYAAGEVVRVEVPIPQAGESEDSDSGDSGLGTGMAALGASAGTAGGNSGAGGAGAAAADPETSDGEDGLGSVSDSSGGYNLDLEDMVAHAASAAARMQRVYRGRVARRQVERAAMADLFPSERPVAAHFDARGEMQTSARTFVADVAGGRRGLLMALTDPTLVQRLTVAVEGGPRPVFRTVHAPFSFIPAEGQRAILLHAEAESSRDAASAAEPSHPPHSQLGTALAGAGAHVPPAQPGAPQQPIETPSEQRLATDVHDSVPHSRTQAGENPTPAAAGARSAPPPDAGAAPAVDDSSARDVKVHIHFLPFFQRPPLLICRRVHFSHHSSQLSEPCQHHATLRDPDSHRSNGVGLSSTLGDFPHRDGATAVETRCAVRMQRKWRWYQTNSRRGLLVPREERSRRTHAAVVVQSAVRGRRAALHMRELQRARNAAGVAAWAALRPLPLPNEFASSADAPRPSASGTTLGACGWVGAGSVAAAAAASELLESRREALARLKEQHGQPRRPPTSRSHPAAAGDGGNPEGESVSRHPSPAVVADVQTADAGASLAVAVAAARLEERRRLVSISRSFRALLAKAAEARVAGAAGRVRPGGDGGRAQVSGPGPSNRTSPGAKQRSVAAPAGGSWEPAPTRGRTRTRRVISRPAVDTAGEAGAGSTSGWAATALPSGIPIARGQRCHSAGGESAWGVEAGPRGPVLAEHAASAQVTEVQRERTGAASVEAEAEAARHRTASTLQGGWRGRADRQLVADIRLLRDAARLPASGERAEALRGLPAGRAIQAIASLAGSAADAKQRAMRAEDFDRAKRCKALAEGLAAHASELRRAEAERARAAATQEYELAISRRETIQALKVGAARLLSEPMAASGRTSRAGGGLETPRPRTAGSCSEESRDAVGSLRDPRGGYTPVRGGGASPVQSSGIISPNRARFDRLVVQTDLRGRSPAASVGASPGAGPGSGIRRTQSSPYCHSAPARAWPQAPFGETGDPPQAPGATAAQTPAQSAATTPPGVTPRGPARSPALVHASSTSSLPPPGPFTPRVPAKAMSPAAAIPAHTAAALAAEAAEAAAAELAVASTASDEALLAGLSLTPADRDALQPIISTFGELSALQLVSGRPALLQAALLRASSQLGSPAVLARRGAAVAALYHLLSRCLASPHPDVVLTALRLLRLALGSTLARANSSPTARAVRELVPLLVQRATIPTPPPASSDGPVLDAGAGAVAAALGWVVALPQVGGARLCAALLCPAPERDGADEVVEMRLSLLLEAIRSVGAAVDAAPPSPAAPPPVPLAAAAAYICAAHRSRPRIRMHAATVARQLQASLHSRADAASLAAALRHGAPELHELCFGGVARPPPGTAPAAPSEAEACAALQQRIARARTRTEALRARLLAMRAATQRHADERARAARHASDEAEGISPVVLAMRAKLEAAHRARDAIDAKARLLRRQSTRVRPDDLGRLERAKALNAQAVEQEQAQRRPAADAARQRARADAATAALRKRQQQLISDIEAAKREAEAARAEAGQMQQALVSG